MIRKIGIVGLCIALLAALIAVGQYRAAPNRVSGFIESDEIRIGSRLGGRVQRVYVEEGQRVTAGEPLVELEPYDLLQREQEAAKTLAALQADYERLQAGFRVEEIAQAEARYEQAKARHDLMVAGPREQEIEVARKRLEVAESEQILAQQNYIRGKRLITENAISQADFDAITESLDAARAQVSMRNEELELLQSGFREEEIREAKAKLGEEEQAWLLTKNGFRREDIAKAKAARDAAESALQVIREQKKELMISCPVDGIVEALDLQTGDLVPAGAPVLSIMDDRHLWIRAYVPQNRIGLQIGQRLRVTVDSFPDKVFEGQVTFLSRQAEFTPNNVQTPEERSKQVFRVKVALRDQKAGLRSGMTADVWLPPPGSSP